MSTGRSSVARGSWIEDLEVLDLVLHGPASIVLGVLESVQHPLVVRLLRFLPRTGSVVLHRLIQQLHKAVEALDVLLDSVKLALALFRLVLFFLAHLLLIHALLRNA